MEESKVKLLNVGLLGKKKSTWKQHW
jgi:hypothetical protein